MKKRIIALLLVLVLLLASCSNVDEPKSTEVPYESYTEAPTETPEPISLLTPETELEKMVFPFWKQNTMYNETLCMTQYEDGKIYAKTLFVPTKIISITDYTYKNAYTEGVDYKWDGKTNTIEWIEGSKIGYFTQNDLNGLDENGKPFITFNGEFDKNGCSRLGGVLYSVGEFVYGRQIAITYEYTAGSYDGYYAEYQGDKCAKFLEKLSNGDPITMVLWGDSIFEGMESSQRWGRKPNQPPFGILIQKYLKTMTSANVKLKNLSVGGKGSDYGLANISNVTKLSNCDIVFIGWGTNDVGQGSTTLSNVTKMIEKIREAFPDCAIVVCSSIHPNDAAGYNKYHSDIAKELEKVKELGCAYVDMYTFHTKLLETKTFIETSGNNINHPNDWLIRIYAMNLLSAIGDWDKVA